MKLMKGMIELAWGAHLSCHRMKLGFLQPPTSPFNLPITFLIQITQDKLGC